MVAASARSKGLSPRVRGNLLQDAVEAGHFRSIPACAGEPLKGLTAAAEFEVYPRVCGGTGYERDMRGALKGLSPRVRGNRAPPGIIEYEKRSIPACAGEPIPIFSKFILNTVYPRVCGGTQRAPVEHFALLGLSPRVRGNRPREPVQAVCSRSIPACAGEPPQSGSGAPLFRVYPRVCGGTRQLPLEHVLVTGLSPRVRGNLRL